MVFKILKLKSNEKYFSNNQCGVTLIELLTVMTLIVLVIVVVTTFVNPVEQKAKARDQKRLSDLSTLDRIINEYRIDQGSYPDVTLTTRLSTTLPLGSTGPVENVRTGWIVGNFSNYNSKLPIDPVNNTIFHYSYRHSQTSYELNAVLEILSEGDNSKDGGNNDEIYELGNDLSLL